MFYGKPYRDVEKWVCTKVPWEKQLSLSVICWTRVARKLPLHLRLISSTSYAKMPVDLMEREPVSRAKIIVVGRELLTGRTLDTNFN